MVVKYSKLQEYVTTFLIPRSSQIYQNWDFWSEKNPSGNPAEIEFLTEPAPLPTNPPQSFLPF
jgi:hypothetical protein